MTPFARAKANRRWAIVAALGIVVIGALEAYALSQGINGTALTASLAGIIGITGASVGRAFK